MKKLAFLVLMAVASISNGFGQTITTIAGTGTLGYSGDGGPATAAQIHSGGNIAIDNAGNVYFPDLSNHRVRKVSTAGVISTIAGNGTAGFSGDGSSGPTAQLSSPSGVAADNLGNIYIADFANNRIRKVNSVGIISTVAGTGTASNTGDGGAAIAATLNGPVGLTCDASGNLYIVDQTNNSVRFIDFSTGVISSIVHGTAGLRPLRRTCGTIQMGDTGPAYNGQLWFPAGITLGSSGNTFICDKNDHRLRYINSSGIINTYAGCGTGFAGDGGAAISCILNMPSDVAEDASGNVYIADLANMRIRKIDNSGIINTIAGNGTSAHSGDGGLAISAQLQGPTGIKLDAAGNIYINDAGAIRKISSGGSNSAPTFSGGTSQSITFCIGSSYNINTLLQINDANSGQTETWSVVMAPAHGSMSGFNYTTTSTGSAITPTGLGYSPTTGYSGTDSFSVKISDGTDTSRTTIHITISPAPSVITGTTSLCASTSATLSDSVSGGIWLSSNTAIASIGFTTGAMSAISGGTSIITYMLPTGCFTTTTVTVATAPAATTVTTTGGSTFCGSTVLTASAASGTLYFQGTTSGGTSTLTPAVTDTVTTSGTYYFRAMSGPGCWGAEGSVTVTINPTPAISVGATPNPVCATQTLNLSATASGGTPTYFYSWTGPAAYTSFTQNPSITGMASTSAGYYTATVTDVNGCQASATTASVTVTALPGTIAGSSSICMGGTSTYSNSTSGGTWASSNTAIAVIGSATGSLSAISTGTAVITYSLGSGCLATISVTVGPLPAAITGTTSFCQGATTSLVTSTSGGTWSSSNTAIATVDATGVTTGLSGGIATITYMLGTGCYATTALTVNSVPSVPAITGTTTICTGGTTLLANSMAGGFWYSTDNSIASVNATGLVTGTGSGVVAIVYGVANTCGVGFASTFVAVSAPTSITGTTVACVGATTTLANATSGGTWSSSNTRVATVSASTGVVTGISVGTARITYLLPCGPISTTVNINPLPAAGTISGGSNVCTGSSITLTSSASGGTWSSSSTANATISAGGVVSGVTTGSTTISYAITNSCGTAIATTVITINTIPSVASISGASSVCEGSNTTLTNSTSGGVWSSSNGAVATTTFAGVVTGISSGTTIISYTVTNTCGTSSVVMNLTVNPLPLPGSISGTSTVCEGASTTLSDAAAGGVWSSTNTTVATINTTGVVTGVSAGTTLISYLVTNGCGSAAATFAVTVNPMPVAGTISGAGTVCVGAVIGLTDATSGGTWNSSSTGIATISATGTVTGVTAGAAIISYAVANSCGSAITSVTITVNPLPVAGVLSGADTLCETATSLFTSTATGGVWSSSSTANATISTGGMVTGVAAGLAIISYTVTNGCGTDAAIQYVTINALPSAAAISGSSSVCAASSISLTNSTSGGTWSSNNTAVATISAAGTLSGVSAGTSIVTYTVSNSCSSAVATKAVTVNPLPNAGTISGATSVCVAATITLASTGTGGTWSSSDASIATINSSGVVTGNASGTAIISYAVTNGCGTASSTYTIAVNPLPSAGTISGTDTLCETTTTLLTSSGTGGMWSSSNVSVATIDATGLVTGVTSGTSTISYNVTNSCGTSVATMSITIKPQPVSSAISGPTVVCESATINLTDASPGGVWNSSNTAVASVSATGILSGVTAGTTTITYSVTNSCGTAIVTSNITVNPAPAAGTISGTATVCEAATTSLTASISGGGWSSSNTAVATISSGGTVTGVTAGTATITYSITNSCGTAVAVYAVTVNPLPNAGAITGASNVVAGTSITLLNAAGGGTWSMANANATITAGGIVTGVVVGLDTVSYTVTNGCGTATATKTISISPSLPPITGTTILCVAATTALSNASSGGTWTSSNASVATIGTTSGIVTGVSAGTVVISYFALSTYVTTVVTVNPLPAAITGTTNICANTSTTLTSSTGGGTWASSNSAVATAGTTGVITGVAAGTTIISYTLSTGCFVVTTVNVNPIANIAGSLSVCSGATITLTDAVTGGTWTSSNTAAATITTSTGIVTGLAAPATSIITYVLSTGCRATAVLTVNPLPAGITGTAIACAGSTTTLANTVSGGSWSSANASIATAASTTGVITGVTGGTTTITYALPTGCYLTKTYTVNPAVAAITGTTTLCGGTSATLSDATTGGTWSSSNTAVASIGSASGIVAGVSNGTAVITYSAGCGIATTTVTVRGAPAITAVSTYIDTVLSPAITITGSNFNAATSGNIVYFGATRATVTAASGTSLTVTVPIDATFSTVSVENTGCLLTAYSQYPFLPTYNNSAYIPTTISCNAKVDFTSASNPFNVAIGDIDGDGKADMIATNYSSNSISIFRNTSTTGTITAGSFAAKVDFTTGAAPYGIAIGDLDGDGKLDIAVTNNSSAPPTVSVFRNTATTGVINSGSLAAKVDFAVGAGPIAVAIADLDKDGKPDLAVANNGANTLSLLRNTSVSGSLTTASFATKVDLVAGNHPFHIAAGDIDGDGKQDLVVPNQAAATVSVFRNTATIGSLTTASFAAKVDFPTASNPYCVAIGDIDGDGKMDVAVANNVGNSVSVLRNTATSGTITAGSLASKVDFTTAAGPYSIAMADINGDGKPDLVTANSTANSVSIFRNTATSGTITTTTFAAKVDFTTGTAPRCIALGDLDGDFKADIATANISANMVSVIRNNPTPHPSGGAPIMAKTLNLCVGNSAILNEPGMGTWTSSNPAIVSVDHAAGTVTGLSVGRAMVVYTSVDKKVIYIPVVVNQVPAQVTISADPGTHVSRGQKVQFTAITLGANEPTYQWYVNNIAINGATGSSFERTNPAWQDAITCRAGSIGCPESVTSNALLLTIAEQQNVLTTSESIHIVPNPNKGTFAVTGSLATISDEEVTIEIVNMLGQIIYSGSTVATHGNINYPIKMNQFTNGMYLLNLRHTGETMTYHFMVAD